MASAGNRDNSNYFVEARHADSPGFPFQTRAAEIQDDAKIDLTDKTFCAIQPNIERTKMKKQRLEGNQHKRRPPERVTEKGHY